MKKMKLMIWFGALFFAAGLMAQQPNEILGIAKESKDVNYYKEQSALWKKETRARPNDANAWRQYYKAERAFLQTTYPEVWLNNSGEIYGKLRVIIDESKKHIDNSFEYYLMEGINVRGKASAAFYKKAFAIDPERDETYEGLFVYYVLTFQKEKASEVAKRMLKSNYFSNANLKWNYNALQTADKNGVFITHGDMDAIPKWVLQYGMNIRPDVLVMNKWMMIDSKQYFDLVFKDLGIKPHAKKPTDFKNPTEHHENLIAYVLKNSKRPVYMGCNTDTKFFKKYGLENNIYLVGAAFVYCSNDLDNMAITKKNFEQTYNLEYLFTNFQQHPDDVVVKKYLNVTYIPGIIKLINHYKLLDDAKKLKYYETLLNRIAEDSGRKKEIMSWYK